MALVRARQGDLGASEANKRKHQNKLDRIRTVAVANPSSI